jgi:uncharacterized membrane protein YqaE (UPF0057 family)
MGLGKALLCIFIPPLAVRDRGCGTMLLVFVLWCCAWIPGSIAAWIISSQPKPGSQPQQVIVIRDKD